MAMSPVVAMAVADKVDLAVTGACRTWNKVVCGDVSFYGIWHKVHQNIGWCEIYPWFFLLLEYKIMPVIMVVFMLVLQGHFLGINLNRKTWCVREGLIDQKYWRKRQRKAIRRPNKPCKSTFEKQKIDGKRTWFAIMWLVIWSWKQQLDRKIFTFRLVQPQW